MSAKTIRRKPLIREAICFDAYTTALAPYPPMPEGGAVWRWVHENGGAFTMGEYPGGRAYLMLALGLGDYERVDIGDWIVRGSSGWEVLRSKDFDADWEVVR